MSEFEITFLGTSASVPSVSRNVSATLIQFEGKRFLVDCGEGTQRQMMKYGGLKAPDVIFLTHYHPDHTLGLPGLFATLKMAEHTAPIKVFGPHGLEGVEKMCRAAGGCPSFVEFHYDMIDYGHVRFDGLTVRSFKTHHGVQSFGYAFEEHDRPGRFDVERARLHGIDPGPEYAKLQKGLCVRNDSGAPVTPEMVIGPPRKGRKVVITGDTAPSPRTVAVAQDADVLIHEATFSQENWERAKKVKHSTARQAADIAVRANVGRLCLTHISPRENTRELQNEAQERFKNSLVAIDGDTISVPVKG